MSLALLFFAESARRRGYRQNEEYPYFSIMLLFNLSLGKIGLNKMCFFFLRKQTNFFVKKYFFSSKDGKAICG